MNPAMLNGWMPLVMLVCVIAWGVWLHLRLQAPESQEPENIEPCPLCGSAAHLCGVSDDAFVRCANPRCSMQGPYGGDESGAVEVWNKLHHAVKNNEEHQPCPN